MGGTAFWGRGRAQSSPRVPWASPRCAGAALAGGSWQGISPREDSLLWSEWGQTQPPLWQAAVPASDLPAAVSNGGRSVRIVNRGQGGSFPLVLHLLVETLLMSLEFNYNSMGTWYLYCKLCQGYFKTHRSMFSLFWIVPTICYLLLAMCEPSLNHTTLFQLPRSCKCMHLL